MSLITYYLSLTYFIVSIAANPIKSFDLIPKQDTQSRNINVPVALASKSTVEFLTQSNHAVTPSPTHLPSSLATLATTTYAAELRRDITMPNLVPTSQVDLATDTTGTRTISPLLVPTAIASIGSLVTTTGCEVTIIDRQYMTYCSNVNGALETATAVALGELEISSGPSWCCGGGDDLHACTEDGTIPKGPEEWTCTLGSTTFVGVTTATAVLG